MAISCKVISSDNSEDAERSMVEHAHELSMSKDPCIAVRGRYMKEVGPSFLRWMTAELERRPKSGDDLENLCEGFAQALANHIGTLAGNITQINNRLSAELVGMIGISMVEYLHQIRESLTQEVKE